MMLFDIRGLSIFINDIRNCKNKKQERLWVDKELGNIRMHFKNKNVRVSTLLFFFFDVISIFSWFFFFGYWYFNFFIGLSLFCIGFLLLLFLSLGFIGFGEKIKDCQLNLGQHGIIRHERHLCFHQRHLKLLEQKVKEVSR